MTDGGKRVALVTGASSGMGKDFALRLLREGFTVYGAARRVDRMDDIVAAGGAAVALDIADEASIVAAVGRIVAECGCIDVLVNNAGYGQYGAIEDVPIDVARRQFEVNLFGLARLTQLVLPHMRAKRYGRIVNIASVGGKVATPLGGWYHATKFALEGWSDSLRVEVRQFGIDVVVIEPGGVQSEWSGIAADGAERFSGAGPYGWMVSKLRAFQAGNMKDAPAKVISDLVVKAATASRPATRYHGGWMAGTMLFLRKRLSDRMFDRVVMTPFR